MLGILWLIVWATVCEAFYDDYNWYTSDDGINDRTMYKYVRENFSENLRTFADSYGLGRGGDNYEMTLVKAKSELRLLKVFKYTGSSTDFDSIKGQTLPFPEGAKYCTTARHTKVDCNHCTCVAGQLYLCTGMICPKAPGKPPSVSTCKEGKKRRIDSCNYCYCRNGHEFCSTKDCRQNRVYFELRSQSRCSEGTQWKDKCNQCICLGGEELCTQINCMEKRRKKKKKKINIAEPCKEGKKRKIDSCNYCYCRNGHEFCSITGCKQNHEQFKFKSPSRCSEGTQWKDKCNQCICLGGEEICTQINCMEKRRKKKKKKINIAEDFEFKSQSKCREGMQWKETCNRCFCLEGEELCTKIHCMEKGTEKKNNEINIADLEFKSHSRCREGTQWKEKCNRCFCHDGEELCTKINCMEKRREKKNNKISEMAWGGRVCTTGDTLRVNCRTCKCYNRQWRCSSRKCGIHKKQTLMLESCTEGYTRQLDSCNKCYCRNGEEYCEMNDCEDERDPENEPEQYSQDDFYLRNRKNKCPEGSRYKIDSCNYCLCFNGSETCTFRNCPTKDLDGMECDPLRDVEAKHIDCNYCQCRKSKEREFMMNDHKWRWCCTKKDCDRQYENYYYDDDHIPDLLRRRKECDRWDVKYEKCNRCECRLNRWICTQRMCKNDKLDNEDGQDYIDGMGNLDNYLYLEACKNGHIRNLDECNKCFCRKGQWYCQNEDCPESKTKPDNSAVYVVPDSIKNMIVIKKSDLFKRPNKSKKKKNNKVPDFNNEFVNEDIADTKNPDNNEIFGNIDIIDNDIIENSNIVDRPDIIGNTYSNEGLQTVNNVKHNGDDRKLLLIPSSTCEKGSKRLLDECNYCYCRGGQWFCENKWCGITGTDQESSTPKVHLNENCKKGEKKKVDCYNCLCTRHGWKCRPKRKNCQVELIFGDSKSLRMHNDSTIPTQTKCNVGDIFRLDACTLCYCADNGEAICSRHNCLYPQVELRSKLYLDPNCVRGAKKTVDCYRCVCRGRRGWSCRKKKRNCIIQIMLRDSVPLRMHYHPLANEKCDVGDRFRLDACNYCYCDENNNRVCSRHQCPYKKIPENEPAQYSPHEHVESQCKIGDRFRLDECNYCYCDPTRRLVCTRNKCSNAKIPLRVAFGYQCVVGEFLRLNDCNYCKCTYNRKWRCSNKVCPSIYDQALRSEQKGCTEGNRRQVNACNYCICQNGVEYCTQKPCSHDQPTHLVLEPECVPGEPVPAPDPCNLCICYHSDILCTDNPCIQRKSVTGNERSGKCVEGEKTSMDDGCNFCICHGGDEFCTARACLVDDTFSSGDKRRCNEGEVTPARDKCNMCVCIQGKRSCTNRECYNRALRSGFIQNILSYFRSQEPRGFVTQKRRYKRPRGTKQRCTQGEIYVPENDDPNCPNTCICDQNELLCTNRKCRKIPSSVGVMDWLSGPDDKYKYPKQLLKQEDCVENQPLPSEDPCNTCICLNARKVCTIISCSETDKKEAKLASKEAGNKRNRGNKWNMEKKNNNFCEPFTFFSPNNNRFCRNCFCLHNGLALCLLNLCKYSKDIPHHSPQELNKVCTPGEIGYPTKCVTCTCSDQGNWVCTREKIALCQERDCDEKDEFHMGFFPYCAGCKCSAKEWFCSIQTETCNDYSNATCPLGTFIHNPNQPCSICLCGGYENGSHNMCFTEAKCVRQVINHLKD